MRVHLIVVVAFGAAVAVAGAVVLLSGPPSVEPARPEPPAPRQELRHLADLHAASRIKPGSPHVPEPYWRARQELLAKGPAALPELRRTIREDPDPAVRLMAIHLTAALGGPAALEALEEAHQDASLDPKLRLSAVDALCALEGADPAPALVRILRTGPGASVAAAELGRRRAGEAVAPLAEALGGSDASLACHAARSLGRIGGAEARVALEAAQSNVHTPVVLESIRQALSFFEESR